MIRLAREYNRFGSRCRYYVNAADDLRMFEDGHFDFIYSNIVLQHIPPEYSTRYIREFIRILDPHGMAVFQVPSAAALRPTPPPLDTMFNAGITAR
jgi:ubiquinone/menaquinone biosynthesis C-methylase UbiE